MAYKNDDIKIQVERYFSALHLHPEGLKGGVFTLMEKNKFKEQHSHGYKKSIEKITNLLYKQERAVFVTLNSYKKDRPTDPYCKRDDKHLWGIDTLMIDIDAPPQLCGVEDELISILKWAWELGKIPTPNLYSYTGSGGIHLYYCIERLPKSMKESINALKWAIAEKIIAYEQDFPTREGYTYKVDTKIFDSQRLDRVPGSIHEDTGKMCVCFTTDQPKYKYKDLLSYCDEESWSAEYKIQDARKYINKLRGIKEEIPTDKPTYKPVIKTEKETDNKYGEKEARALCKKRINTLFTLAKNGKDFRNCREIACFILRTWCMQLEYDETKTIKYLKMFNNLLEEPLSEKELLNNTKCRKQYKFTNAYLKDALNLTEKELLMFSKKYRPGNRKERTLIDKINIAKLLIKGISSDEICDKLGISLSLLKRRRTEMKKAEGLEFWANYVIPVERHKKAFIAIIKNLKEKIGEQRENFRIYLENVVYKKCYEKYSMIVSMMFDILKNFDMNDLKGWSVGLLSNSS